MAAAVANHRSLEFPSYRDCDNSLNRIRQHGAEQAGSSSSPFMQNETLFLFSIAGIRSFYRLFQDRQEMHLEIRIRNLDNYTVILDFNIAPVNVPRFPPNREEHVLPYLRRLGGQFQMNTMFPRGVNWSKVFVLSRVVCQAFFATHDSDVFEFSHLFLLCVCSFRLSVAEMISPTRPMLQFHLLECQ
jgi:hypothetical protein